MPLTAISHVLAKLIKLTPCIIMLADFQDKKYTLPHGGNNEDHPISLEPKQVNPLAGGGLFDHLIRNDAKKL